LLPETERARAVLELRMADVRAAAAPGTPVDAGPTWVLLDDMIARGWPRSWIARELGFFGRALQMNRETVVAATAAKVVELDRRVGPMCPPPRKRGQSMPPLDELLLTGLDRSA